MAALKMPFSEADPYVIEEEIKGYKHFQLPKGFSPRFKALLSMMLKIDPSERLTIDQILADPSVKMHVTEWVNSNLFQVYFKEVEENRFISSDQPFQLFKIEVPDKGIDLAYRNYV